MPRQVHIITGDASPQPDHDPAGIRAAVHPFALHRFEQLPSTNDFAAEKLCAGEFAPPAIVLADRQVAGRGQRSNTWWSTDGSLTASFVIPASSETVPTLLPILAGVAVREAIVAVTACPRIALKWPNDVVLGDRKLAGILCERHHGADVIGVGINVDVDRGAIPDELADRVASVAELAASPVGCATMLIALAGELARLLSSGQAEIRSNMLVAYERCLVLRGRVIEIETDDGRRLRGVCRGVDLIGRLVVDDRGEIHPVTGRVLRYAD